MRSQNPFSMVGIVSEKRNDNSWSMSSLRDTKNCNTTEKNKPLEKTQFSGKSYQKASQKESIFATGK